MKLDIEYADADRPTMAHLGEEWGQWASRHVDLENGFAIVAKTRGEVVGLIGVLWKQLPTPLPTTREAFINIIEVVQEHRRRGIATTMIAMSEERARAKGVCQIRAWSSEDKTAAIPMWRALGFGMCPAVDYPGGQRVEGYFVVKTL